MASLHHRDVAEGAARGMRIAALFGFQVQMGAQFALEVVVAVWAVPGHRW